MLLMASMLIITVFLLFNASFLKLFGASHEILSFAHVILNIYLFGTLGVLISLGLDRLIASQGYSKTAIQGICCCCCEHYPRHHFYLWYEFGLIDFIARLTNHQRSRAYCT
ncbi:MATE family efflux transporter [Paenibacillus sp. OK060]|uniref:MATE family efflux transporter n=1 Tax=Paenibacillus sp. OK060 TaxID=1881034 RepID=UPI000B8A4CF5